MSVLVIVLMIAGLIPMSLLAAVNEPTIRYVIVETNLAKIPITLKGSIEHGL